MKRSRLIDTGILTGILLLTSSSAFGLKLPEQIELSPVVKKLTNDPITSPGERRQLAIFHGQWGSLDDLTVDEQAINRPCRVHFEL